MYIFSLFYPFGAGKKRENNNVNIRILSTYYSWQVSFIKVVIAQRRRNAFFVFFYFKKERKSFEIILHLFQKWLRSKLTILALMIRIDVLVTFIKIDCLGYFNHLLAILATSKSKLTILATFLKIGYFGYLNQNWLFWLLFSRLAILVTFIIIDYFITKIKIDYFGYFDYFNPTYYFGYFHQNWPFWLLFANLIFVTFATLNNFCYYIWLFWLIKIGFLLNTLPSDNYKIHA